MPGAFTPTEVLTAWEAGADVVKVFPADVGGPTYLKALRGPLPQVRLMPTGGVDLNTAEAFLKAGALCLGLGEPAHQGAADDQAVGHRGERPDVLGRADPEPDADRQLGLQAEPRDVLGQLGRQRLALHRDPCHRNVIEEPGRRPGDLERAV